MIMLAHASGEVREIEMRTARRLAAVEVRRQENIEAVVAAALPKLPDGDVTSDPVDPDWMARFFEGAQDVSDEQLRDLLAAILAGEVVKPGTVSRRTLSIVKDLGRTNVLAFKKLSAMAWELGDGDYVLVPDYESLKGAERRRRFERYDVAYDEIRELESFGLFENTGGLTEIIRLPHGPRSVLSYCGRPFEFARAGDEARSVPFERLRLTASGSELTRVMVAQGDDAYLSALFNYLREAGGIEVHELPAVDG